MPRYAAMLRAVNVGGTGKLPMTDLKRMGEEAGFEAVSTYIASGNLVFRSAQGEKAVRAALEKALEVYAGKPVAVHVRTAEELADLVARNPFPDRAPNRVVAILVDGPIPANAIEQARGRKDEEIALGEREIFVHYGDGMADSRLRIPAGDEGTARNINTLTKLARLTATL
ncbi:MAG: DUF1697 domain-containing protein [Sphingobium sp.]|nr:DUF1697 domain-containing protein [Sphingobium sp.]